MKENKKAFVLKIIVTVFIAACMIVPAIMHMAIKIEDMELKGNEVAVMVIGIALAIVYAAIIIFKFIKPEPKE